MLKTAVAPYVPKITVASVLGMLVALEVVHWRHEHRHQPFYRRVLVH
jgi:hypothetical protein